MDHLETQLPTYWSTSFTKICLGMKVNGVTRFLQVDKAAASLDDLIADGKYRHTSLGRDEWKTLIGPDASLQLKCNKEGFNSQGTMHRTSRVRIGIIANQENDCNFPDSRIGFGGGGSGFENACGNGASWSADNGDKNIKAFGYIFVQ